MLALFGAAPQATQIVPRLSVCLPRRWRMEQDGICHPRYRGPGHDAGWSRMGRMVFFCCCYSWRCRAHRRRRKRAPRRLITIFLVQKHTHTRNPPVARIGGGGRAGMRGAGDGFYCNCQQRKKTARKRRGTANRLPFARAPPCHRRTPPPPPRAMRTPPPPSLCLVGVVPVAARARYALGTYRRGSPVVLVVSIVIAIQVSIVSRRVVVVVASVVSSYHTHVRYGTKKVGFSRGDGAKKRQWNTDGGRPSPLLPPRRSASFSCSPPTAARTPP